MRGHLGGGVARLAALEPQVQARAQQDDGGDIQQRPQQLHRLPAVVAEVQRLRDQQRFQIPRQYRGVRQLARVRIDQHGPVHARAERLVAVHVDAVVMLAAEIGARERDEGHAHARQRCLGRLDRIVHRRGVRQRLLAFVLLEDLRQLVLLVVLVHQVGPGIDHPGAADDEQPDQRDDAQHIVHVEPLQARAALLAHGAEIELAHERRIQHDATDDGHQQQQGHEAQEQHPGQAHEQVDVQRQHRRHEDAALEGRLGDHLRGTGIDRDRLVIVVVHVVGQRDVPDLGHVGFLRDEHRLLGRVQLFRRRDHGVDVPLRHWAGQHGRLDLGAQQVADFVVVDQRQTGQAQQQHEDGADQAAPLVDPAPAAQGDG